MVQRKAPHEIGPQSETKRSHVNKLETHSSSSSSSHRQQQDTRSKGGGGGDLKKKMKLERSIRAADLESLQDSPVKMKQQQPKKRSSPNYMKPTSSWDARKEQPKVTDHAQTSNDKKRSPRSSKNSISLGRQSSLKAIRPLIKMNLINRATCSSTLKESKFPVALDLSPEGTSVMRVCPYTYCSLNGHRHEALPPLKCFVAARRKLLKTQKSMKLKGVSSSLGSQALGKDEEIDTGQRATSQASPSLEEPEDDFFVEIYTGSKPEDQIVYEDGQDQSSEGSNEEVDVVMSSLEFVECDQQVDDADEEKTPSLPAEDDEFGGLLEKANEGVVESESKAHTFEFNWEDEVGSPFPDNTTECSECADDCYGQAQNDRLSSCDVSQSDVEERQEVNREAAADGIDASNCDELIVIVEADAESEQEVDREVTEGKDAMATDDCNLEGTDIDSHEGEEFCRDTESESSAENHNTCHLCDLKENTSGISFQGSEEVVLKDAEEGSEEEHALPRNSSDESSILEADGPDEQQNLLKETENEKEDEHAGSSSMIHLFDPRNGLKEPVQCITGNDCIQNNPEIVFNCDDATEDAGTCTDAQSCSSDDQPDHIDTDESWGSENEPQDEVSQTEGGIPKSNARIRIGRKKKIALESDEMRGFNPRPPRFLDVEPDPEAEKVDLRHQEMDERKNSEEYLIDHALQRAVTKLAPARKRKVALLVEAFETVMPLPAREKPMRHSAPGFIQGRIMQACS